MILSEILSIAAKEITFEVVKFSKFAFLKMDVLKNKATRIQF